MLHSYLISAHESITHRATIKFRFIKRTICSWFIPYWLEISSRQRNDSLHISKWCHATLLPTTGSEHNSSHTILPEEIQWNVYCLIATKTLRARSHYVLAVLTSHLIYIFFFGCKTKWGTAYWCHCFTFSHFSEYNKEVWYEITVSHYSLW